MVNKWDAIVAYFGDKSLRRIERSKIGLAELPDETIEYLAKIGLVKSSSRLHQSLGISFETEDVKPVSGVFAESDNVLGELAQWIVIGRCFEQLLCIESPRGRVFLIEGTPDDGFIKRMVNSSLPQFMLCTTKALQFFDESVRTGATTRSLEHLVDELTKIDESAFSKSIYWWPTILEEIRRGQM